MKTITLATGKQRQIEALKCGQVEAAQKVMLEVQKESNLILAEIMWRRAAAQLCADAIANAGTAVTVDDVMNDFTEAELVEMGEQVRNYNGLVEQKVGETTAAGSTLPTSTAA
jgi:hypothetical protein